MFLGIDPSTYLEELEHGARYTRDGKPVEVLDTFKQNGVNYIRLRLWNHPADEHGKSYLAGHSDLKTVVRLAEMAKEKGYRFLLDFHYSDFWADPGKQCIPKAWVPVANFGPECLANQVYVYTKEVLEELIEHDLAPQMIQIGNEITNGILWPVGKLEEHKDADGGDLPRTNYHNLALLLKAGLRAAKELCPECETMLHLERSYDQKVYYEFFSNILAEGAEFDLIGMSYYPYWHGTFEEFFANVRMCQQNFGKKVVVAELGYAFTLEDYIFTNNGAPGQSGQLVVNQENVRDFGFIEEYPLTPEGQKRFVEEFLKRARQNDIYGVFYWEPAWIPGDGICWASREGQAYIGELGKETRNEWANQCLFDYEGKALPALEAFRV